MIADRFMDFLATGYKETPEQPTAGVQVAAGPTQQYPQVMTDSGPATYIELRGMAEPDKTPTTQRFHPRTGRPITGPTMSDITEPAMGLMNMGAATAKGATQGFFGLPGDIEALGYGVKELINRGADESMTNAFMRGLQEKTIAPTTEDVRKWLDTNVGKVGDGTSPYETVGEVLAPGGQYKAGKALIKGAASLAPEAGQAIIKSMEKLGTPVQMYAVPEGQSFSKSNVELQPGVNVSAGNKIGVEQDLRVKVDLPNLEMPEKPLLVLSTDEKNVNRQIQNLDIVLQKFPNPELNQESWSRMFAFAFKSDEVPLPPYAAIKYLESAETMAAPLRKLTQGQIADANAGFKNAAEFKNLYTSGKADVVTTGKLFLWSFLSRGVSPYMQEGLFMDAISGIEPFLKKTASGKFDAKDLDEYLQWASTVASKGSGQPGSGAIHNLNAFGKNFLTKLAIPDASGKTGLQKVHEMMADPDMTGQQIRREFAKIGTGVGIDNKVVSFTLLVSGRDDVLVIDRVQLRNLWDDGRFAAKNLWDGRSEKRLVKQKDGTEVEKNAQIAGTALSEITYGVKGLMVYEALERAMAQKIKETYRLVGREADASLGRYHWETWVVGSQQEASHGTIDAIMREAAGVKQPFKGVTAKQGEYGMFDYGAKYGVDEKGPYFIYDNSKGNEYRFTVPEYREMLAAIKDPKSGIIPKNFKVSASGSSPWFERPEVNRSKLDDLIAARGSSVGSSSIGEQPISANGQSATANGARVAPSRRKSTSVNESQLAPKPGAK